jgi:hypothetical protein
MALEVSRLFGGFFLAPAMDVKWAVWLDAISYGEPDFPRQAAEQGFVPPSLLHAGSPQSLKVVDSVLQCATATLVLR